MSTPQSKQLTKLSTVKTNVCFLHTHNAKQCSSNKRKLIRDLWNQLASEVLPKYIVTLSRIRYNHLCDAKWNKWVVCLYYVIAMYTLQKRDIIFSSAMILKSNMFVLTYTQQIFVRHNRIKSTICSTIFDTNKYHFPAILLTAMIYSLCYEGKKNEKYDILMLIKYLHYFYFITLKWNKKCWAWYSCSVVFFTSLYIIA